MLDILLDLNKDLEVAQTAKVRGQIDLEDLSHGLQTAGLSQSQGLEGDSQALQSQSLARETSLQALRCEAVVSLLRDVSGGWAMLSHAVVGLVSSDSGEQAANMSESEAQV
jgi:hypothetical protein